LRAILLSLLVLLASAIVVSSNAVLEPIPPWSSTCPVPMTWGGGYAHEVPEYPRLCTTHKIDESVAWKKIATEVTFDTTHDHSDDKPSGDYHVWAHVLIYPNDMWDRTITGVFSHQKIEEKLSTVCGEKEYTTCTNFSHTSYGLHQPNASKTGCISTGEAPPNDLVCPVNGTVNLQFCMHTHRESKDSIVSVDTWVSINQTAASFIEKSNLLNAFTGKEVPCDF